MNKLILLDDTSVVTPNPKFLQVRRVERLDESMIIVRVAQKHVLTRIAVVFHA